MNERSGHEPARLLAFGPLVRQLSKGTRHAYTYRRIDGVLQLWWSRELAQDEWDMLS